MAGSALFLVVALTFAGMSVRLVAAGQRTRGRIIDLVESRSRGSVTAQPVVGFTDSGGVPRVSKCRLGRPVDEFRVGQEVPVIYVPGSESSAQIDSFEDLWMVPTVFGVTGAVTMTVAVWFLRRKSAGR